MLKKIERSLTGKDFDKSRNEGILWQTPLFGVSVIDREKTKFGFVISKKISKRAVDRNRIKRLLAEAVKTNRESLGVKGRQIIFLAKRSALGKKFSEIETEVKKVFDLISNEKNTS